MKVSPWTYFSLGSGASASLVSAVLASRHSPRLSLLDLALCAACVASAIYLTSRGK